MNIRSGSFPLGLPSLRSEEEARRTLRPESMASVITRCADASVATRRVPKTCPWCGSDPELAERASGIFLVGCTNDDCGITAQAAGDTAEEAWKLWNTRTPSNAQADGKAL